MLKNNIVSSLVYRVFWNFLDICFVTASRNLRFGDGRVPWGGDLTVLAPGMGCLTGHLFS